MGVGYISIEFQAQHSQSMIVSAVSGHWGSNVRSMSPLTLIAQTPMAPTLAEAIKPVQSGR